MNHQWMEFSGQEFNTLNEQFSGHVRYLSYSSEHPWYNFNALNFNIYIILKHRHK